MNINNNPIFKKNNNFDEAFPFNEIKAEHFLPAIKHSIQLAEMNIDEIADSSESPTFENTVLALENSSEYLDTATSIYYHLFSSKATDEIEKLAEKISPMLADFSNNIYLNNNLFKRIAKVEEDSNSYGKEEARLIKVYYRRFVRNGAALNAEKKEKLREIDSELASLSPKFSTNVRNATNNFELVITDKKDLEGLPKTAIDAAHEEAALKNQKGKWLFTLDFPSMMPVMKYLKNRTLREKMSKAFSQKCFGDKFDNSNLIKNIVSLKHKRAILLGYKNFAEYTLEERMAGSSSTVYELLDGIYDHCFPVAKNEIAELKTFAQAEDNIENLMPWDYAYYAEKLKKMLFEIDEQEFRPYLSSDKVISGVFEIAKKLYGLSFKENKDIPVWNEDVKSFEAYEEDGNYIGLLYVDLYPRKSKRGGAWMNELRSHGVAGDKINKPHITLTCNLTKPTKDTPSLLNLNEVTTIFHEFGHCLHGLLSNVKYKTIGGTSVFWDFVELPSQIMENWVMEEEALNIFAEHYETGEKIPTELIKKLKKSKNFMMGNMYLRQLQFGYLDMAYHDNVIEIPDIEAFEEVVIGKTRLLPHIEGSTTSCGFSHIFAGGYAAGYYSYKWAEVLEADAFEKFKKDGIFNKETARSFRENILSKGNLEPPMTLYKKFRGREPELESLLKRDGLLESSEA